MSDLSPRVNAAHLAQFIERIVRLPCRVMSRHPNEVLVEACDGGRVKIRITQEHVGQLQGTFVEIIGKVLDESTIKCLHALNLDSARELDMKLVNDAVEMTFDPRLRKIFPL